MIKKFLAGFLVVTSAAIMAPGVSQAMMTQGQIDSILSLLDSFGVDAATRANVEGALNGTPVTTTGGSTGTTCTTNSSYVHTVTLRQGSRGAKVTELQTVLNSLGFNVGSADGVFGGMTKTGVMAFQSSMALTADGIVGPNTGSKIAMEASSSTCTPTTGGGNTTPVVTTGSVNAMLAASTPATTAIVAGQAIADLAHFTFSNGTSSEVKVTNLVFNRTGVSVDTTISKAYIFDSMGARLTDSATVSNGKITFNNPVGLFTVPANSNMTVSFRANVATGTAGQFLGVSLASYTTMGQAAMATNLAGSIHTIATATIAGVDFNNTTTPSSAASIDAQTDYRLWQNVVSVTNEDVSLHRITFRQVGSADPQDLTNLKFYVKGQQKGATMPSLDATNHVTFDFSANPVVLTTGSSELKLTGDISGNTSNETIEFMIREAADVVAKDTQLGVFVTPTENSASFATVDTATLTVNQGTLTFTKATNSPAGTIVDDASGVVLGTWEVKAFGEAMKIEDLTVGFTTSTDGGSTLSHLRNGAVFVDGVQVGSTASILAAGTEYSFGSSFIVNPGTTRMVEVRGDIYDDNGAEGTDSGDVFTAQINAGSSNVERMSSAGFISAPASAVTANALTVGTGVPSIAEDTSYSDRTTVAPKTAYKLGDFTLQADSTEGINITGVDVDFTGADAADASNDLQNLYITIGSFTSTIKSAVTDSGNNFSVNIDVPAGQSVEIAVYADVLSSITDGDGTDDTLTITGSTGMQVDYTTLSSSTSSNVATGGQTITFGSGDLTVELDGTSKQNRIVAGNQTVTAAKYLLTAVSENYFVKEFAVEVPSVTAAKNVQKAMLYVDGVQVGSDTSFVQNSGVRALFTGLNIPVPANGTEVVEVRFMLNTVGGDDGSSGTNTFAKLETAATKVADSQGVETLLSAAPFSEADVNGNEMYVFRTIPTVSKQDPADGSEANGTKKVYKWTVGADAAGDLAVKQFKINLTWNDASTTSTLALGSFNLYEDGSEITDKVTITEQDGDNLEAANALEADTALWIFWDNTQESVIPAGGTKTYTLEGSFSGFSESGDSVTLQLVGDTAIQTASHTYLNESASGDELTLHDSAAAAASGGEAASFIWSDRSANPHANNVNASSSADWANGYKVLNLDLGSQTWKLQF